MASPYSHLRFPGEFAAVIPPGNPPPDGNPTTFATLRAAPYVKCDLKIVV